LPFQVQFVIILFTQIFNSVVCSLEVVGVYKNGIRPKSMSAVLVP